MNGKKLSEYRFLPGGAPLVIESGMELRMERARRFAGMSVTEWNALPGTQLWVDPREPMYAKADYIAFCEIDELMQAAIADHQHRQAKSKAKR